MNTRAAAARILSSYNLQCFNYDRKISDTAAQLKLSQKDQDFLYILVKGVILYRAYLDYVIQMILHAPIDKLESVVLNLLRVGVFQYLILETPRYAVTNETVKAAKSLKKFSAVGLINATLRHLPTKEIIDKQLDQLADNEALAVRESHPSWLIDRWIKQYGLKNTKLIASFNNIYQTIYFRHNPVKTDWDSLKSKIVEMGLKIEIEVVEPIVFFSVNKPGLLLKNKLFEEGFFSVQDISQSLAVRLLNSHNEEIIIDACAAPGGKTGFIAQMTGPTKGIYAYDISPEKIKMLKNETFRLGLDFVNYEVADAGTDTFPKADKILLDVPCSGTGVLARRADLRWNRKEKDIDKLVKKQRQILDNMAQYLNPGGVIVYSTCSIEPEENEGNIDWFLKKHSSFEIDAANRFVENKWCDESGAVRILPHIHQKTGSFAVRLLNKGKLISKNISG